MTIVNNHRIEICFKTMDYQAKEQMLLFKSRITSKAFSICILGPDGSGKTTLINSLTEKLKDSGYKVKYEHFRPKIRQYLNSSVQTPLQITDPHYLPPRHNIISAIKLLGFVIMYYFDYFINLSKCNKDIKIWDRYIYDVYVDPVRYRLQLPKALLKLFMFLSPNPDIVFILDVDPDKLRTRKIEVSAKENERQYYAYKRIAMLVPNSYLINADQDPLDVLDDTWNLLQRENRIRQNLIL